MDKKERSQHVTVAKKYRYFCAKAMYVFLKSLVFCKIARRTLKITGFLEKTGLGQFFKTHGICK